MSLRERRDILQLARTAPGGVLVTLVRAAGSSYRQPGARLLALPDGQTAGTISGGCLEADLLRKAEWRVRNGAVLHSYDTGFDDTAEIPFGLGCGGVVDLLLEPMGAPETVAGLHAIEAALQGETRSVVTRLPSHPEGFARVVLHAGGDVLFATDSLPTERIVELRRLARSSEPAPDDIFVEHLLPAQRLLLCGAGEDARPVARLASALGWTVVVLDGRPQQARADRFPEADAVVVTDSMATVAPGMADAAVVMTHSFEQDRALLAQMLGLPAGQRPRYIGLLGARHRSALLLQQAAEEAGVSLAEALDAVHAPIGLELGGDGPESIALAIVAEVQHALFVAAAAAQGSGKKTPGDASQPRARRMSAAEAERALERFGGVLPALPVCALDGNPAEAVLDGAALAGAPQSERRTA